MIDITQIRRIAVQAELSTEDGDGLQATDVRLIAFARTIYNLGMSDKELYFASELKKERNATLEECASLFDGEPSEMWMARDIAESIRAMKE